MTHQAQPSDEWRSGPQESRLNVPVVIVGAGPVGLTLGLGLARLGIRSVILDQDDKLSDGSRAICIQRHTLEIFERLGTVEPMMAKGVTWNLGRVFWQQRELFQIRLPESDEAFPPFINLQQSYTERYLLDALDGQSLCEVRRRHKVTGLAQTDSAVTVTAETPEGEKQFMAEYLLAADGARSTVRALLGISFDGRTYADRFLIADIRAKLDLPNERWFWFDPVFNPGKSALIHPQPDGEWRLDWQLGADADIESRMETRSLDKLIRATIGARDYEVVWLTAYIFHERIASRFREGRVFLAGDAAHLFSPFGARGMNSGVQDAANVVWKLWLVMSGKARNELLETYEIERRAAAVENVRITDGSMRFIAPQTRWSLWWRNLILRGSVRFAMVRGLVNSGRLSAPFVYDSSPLTDPLEHLPSWGRRLISPALRGAVSDFKRGPRAGELAPDAPYRNSDGGPQQRVLHLIGNHFLVLYFSDSPARAERELAAALSNGRDVPTRACVISSLRVDDAGSAETIEHIWDRDSRLARRYAAGDGTLYLIRPDGHIATRGFHFPIAKLNRALAYAIGETGNSP